MWEAIIDFIYNIVAWFANVCGDWGMGIIIVTIIFRAIIFPLAYKQNKSTYLMQKLQPKMQEIQTLYADDQQKQAEEMQRLYREAHYNPLSGCLPMLIQMPIFIALFQALRSITDRVEPGTTLRLYGIIPDITITPMEALNQSVLMSIPYFILVAIFACSIIVPMLIQKNTQKQQMITMVIMTVFMAYIGCVSPAGVVLFWDVSSIIAVVTQLVMQHHYKKADEIKEAQEIKPVKVNVVRKQKKARPTKSR